MVQLSKKEAKIVNDTLDAWEHEQALSTHDTSRLRASIKVVGFNWHKLAKYCFWIAVIAVIISVTSLIADKYIQQVFSFLFTAPPIVRAVYLAIIAAILYYLGFRRQHKHPEKAQSADAILFLGVIATAAAVYQLGLAMDNGSGHVSVLFLIAAIIYAAIGIFFRSKLIWIFALLSLASWFGAETGYMSGWGAYYLGMSYPLRFVLFGGLLTFAAFQMQRHPRVSTLTDTTLIMGLLYLFIALWILSIFGDYHEYDKWVAAKQIELFHWSLLFAIAAIAAIYHGIRYENNITKGFGLTFLFINLYTRFFEYFWVHLHKGIFFGLLAVSFWYLGTKAEKIWHVENMIGLKKH